MRGGGGTKTRLLHYMIPEYWRIAYIRQRKIRTHISVTHKRQKRFIYDTYTAIKHMFFDNFSSNKVYIFYFFFFSSTQITIFLGIQQNKCLFALYTLCIFFFSQKFPATRKYTVDTFQFSWEICKKKKKTLSYFIPFFFSKY